MSNVDQAMTEGPLACPTARSAVLERLVPGAEGPVRFRMHPWEGADSIWIWSSRTARDPRPPQHSRHAGDPAEATTVEGTARQDHLDRIALALETIENSPSKRWSCPAV